MNTNNNNTTEHNSNNNNNHYQFWYPDSIAITSYPRSGNTLLRTIIEKLTNTITGSDARIDRPLVKQLLEMGMYGEGEMDSTHKVWCIKTHYPERTGKAKLHVKRAIILVRNPFDTIASNFHMLITGSHTESVPDSDILMGGKYHELWKDWVLEEMMIWKQFHEHWRNIPNTLTIRYEDLIEYRNIEIQRLAQFLYNPLFYENDVSNNHLPSNQTESCVFTRAMDLSTIPQSKLGIYTPREATLPVSSSSSSSSSMNGSNPIVVTSDDSRNSINPTIIQNYFQSQPGGDYHVVNINKKLTSSNNILLKSLRLYTNEQYRFVIGALRSELCRFGYWDMIISARPDIAPQIYPWIDFPSDGCLLLLKQSSSSPEVATTLSSDDDQHNTNTTPIIEIVLNGRWGLRPSTPQDPNRRGFDLRWQTRINECNNKQ
jgi:hypothetical protein